MTMKTSMTLLCTVLMTIGTFAQQNFSNFQDASMVIGQPDFRSQWINISDSISITASSIAISSQGMLALAELKSGSIKIWYELPDNNGQPADVEVGNRDFTTINPGPSEFYSSSFNGVAWSPDGKKLIASCGDQNRVLIWNSIPVRNGQPADVVVGQSDFYLTGASTKKNRLDHPAGILVAPDGRMLVADMNSNRVLIWNEIPTVNSKEADVVIGQETFNSSDSGANANQLYHPHSVHLTPSGQLLITNELSHQVFVYDSIPVTDGESATIVIGHDDFGISSSGTSQTEMNMPYSVITTYEGKLAVAEYGNNRVLVYNSLPTANGAKADLVLGQQDFSSSVNFAPSGSPTSNNFSGVSDVVSDLNGRLWVAGISMNRVMVFGDLPKQSADLEITLEQSDMVLCENSDIVYKINLFNAGPDTAFNVVATAAFPLGYTFENSKTENGIYNHRSGHWQIPSIPPNENATLLIDGFVNGDVKTFTFTSYASIIGSSARDENLKNNATSAVVTIQSIKKPDDPIVSDMKICNGQRTMLFADGSGTILWYSEDDFFTPIAKGATYITGPLHESTTFYAKSLDGCPGTTRVPLQVDVLPTYSFSDTVFICSGSNFTYPDGITQTNITSATSHISRFSTIDYCDSIINTRVNVYPVYNIVEEFAICSGEVYTFPDGSTQNNITSMVTYVSNLLTINGCDSIITTTVNVNPVFNLSDTAMVCSGDSYTFPDGFIQNNITSTITHVSNLLTINGCDSIITTTINVNPVYNLTVTDIVCSGDSYTFSDGFIQTNITSSVIHVSNIPTIHGCDSIITATVNVNTVYNLSESVVVCSGESYTFPDGAIQNNITSTILYISNLVTMDGCDSVINTTVNINPVYNISESVVVCSGESYTFPDGTTQNNITSTIQYVSNLTTVDGCDSLISTTVNVNSVYISEAVTICSGDSYTFPDGTIQDSIISSVSYTSNLITVNGCDSIIVTNIDIASVDVSVSQAGTTLTANADGPDFQWIDCDDNNSVIAGENSQSFTASQSGNYAVIISENGCSDTSDCYNIALTEIDENIMNQEFKVYPNPTKDNLTIYLVDYSQNINVSVLDMQGQIVLEQIFEHEEDEIHLDLQNLRSGMYLIHLNTDKKDTLLKILKE